MKKFKILLLVSIILTQSIFAIEVQLIDGPYKGKIFKPKATTFYIWGILNVGSTVRSWSIKPIRKFLFKNAGTPYSIEALTSVIYYGQIDDKHYCVSSEWIAKEDIKKIVEKDPLRFAAPSDASLLNAVSEAPEVGVAAPLSTCGCASASCNVINYYCDKKPTITCDKCQRIGYCSYSHLRIDQERHSKFCDNYHAPVGKFGLYYKVSELEFDETVGESSTGKHACKICAEPCATRCITCKTTYYCSREHQLQDSQSHNVFCNYLKFGINPESGWSVLLLGKNKFTDSSQKTATSVSSIKNQCKVCSQPCKMRCAKCKKAYYCSVEHQKNDWETHKLLCNQ